MIGLAILLLAIPAFRAYQEWREGPILCLATAILQDPFRKLTPDKPVLFVVFAGVVFGAACLGAWTRGMPWSPNFIFGRNQQLTTPISLLLMLIIVEAFNSFVRFGNPIIPAVGLLTYLLPIPAIVFAYYLTIRQGEVCIHQFMKYYIVCIILALTTVYLEFAGYDWAVLGQVGPKLLIYDRATGQVITPRSGIFRASEIAAWHAMTCACFTLLLATLRKFNIRTFLTGAIVVVLLLGIAVLTGRRKAVIEVAVFAGTYLILWTIFQKRMAKLSLALIIAGVVGLGGLVQQLGGEIELSNNVESLGYSLYVERSKTVFRDAPSRFVELGVAPVLGVYDDFGPLGAGLGVGTQGTQYFGGVMEGAAEGGLGKITLELGIPGLFLMGWLAVSVIVHLWRIMRDASRISPRIARLSYGLFSFLMANVAAFSVATQAYGDLFILLILGWTLGFLFAVPVLLERELHARQPAKFEELPPVLRPMAV